ncbi:hypothetical protein U1Q18_036468, partial [Sarracenia purpurea var. burkii]
IEGGATEAFVSYLNLKPPTKEKGNLNVSCEEDEGTEQEKAEARGNKVPFSPLVDYQINSSNFNLISAEKCCADVGFNGIPALANMNFLSGHMGRVSTPALQVLDKNPQLGCAATIGGRQATTLLPLVG